MKNYIRSIASVALFILASGSAFGQSIESSPKVKEWTMMVFLNGNNSLDEFGEVNINQMEQSGSDEQKNIVVQWASLKEKSTKRLYIHKDNDTKKVTSPVIQDVGEVDMGAKQSLIDFIAWSQKHYPAKHYFIVVWNHGGGWHFASPMALGADIHPTDISWDEKTGNHISTEELGEVMKTAAKMFGHKVDIYGSDACLMSMVEVAQQMDGAVGTFLGSEETEPGTGWPYDTFLSDWKNNPAATPLEIGKMLAARYGALYNGGGEHATFSVFDMSKLPSFVKSVAQLQVQFAALPDKGAVMKEAKLALRFFDYDYVDLVDVLKHVAPVTADPATLAAIAAVKAEVSKLVYFTTSNCDAGGVSIWWPTDADTWKTLQERYAGLSFNLATNWHDFLATLF